jgi:hypothetical protein
VDVVEGVKVGVEVDVGVAVGVEVVVGLWVLVWLNVWEGVFEGVAEIVREAVHEREGVAVGELVEDGDVVEVRVDVGVSVGEREPVEVSVSVGEGEPAITAAIIRILWLLKSTTMMFLELLSTAMPLGLLKSAAVPTPFMLPESVPVVPPPTTVVTTPEGVIKRIWWL